MASQLATKCQVPLVVVLGATGAGKSKLALQLAAKFGGEIISADAMQMYKGLDIVTNKVTPEERDLVKHHMIDFLDPMLKCTVVDFRNKALPIVEDLLSRNVMPVVCGGTNYYIESLLWQVLVDSPEMPRAKKMKEDEKEDDDDDQVSNQALYARLKEVDPDRANELHPNERRKIRRSLQVYEKHGRTHSQLLKEQRQQNDGGLLGGPLRYPIDRLAVVWVQCDQKTLDERCDRRVDSMIEQGLLKELQDFDSQCGPDKDNRDYTVGIFQSIGFKEFDGYLKETDPKVKAELWSKAKANMKTATRQYARKQTKWIRQRFLRPDRHCPPVYSVDSTDPSVWTEQVYEPAEAVVQAFVDEKVPAANPLELLHTAYSHEESRKMFHCDVCNIDVKGRNQLDMHSKSRKHQNVMKKKRKQTMYTITKGPNVKKMEGIPEGLTQHTLDVIRQFIKGEKESQQLSLVTQDEVQQLSDLGFKVDVVE